MQNPPKNPLKKADLFNTPNSVEDLHAYIERMNGSEKVMAYTIMGMTWNLASDKVDEALAE